MTVLMTDAYEMLGDHARKASTCGSLYDILYADDTLLIGVAARDVQELAKAVELAGAEHVAALGEGTSNAGVH